MLKKLVFLLALSCGFSAQSALLFNTNAPGWKYFKGRSEASSPDTAAWRQLSFDDSSWTTAPAPFWYGDVRPGGTQITDMQNQYTTFYMRRAFNVDDVSQVSGLRLTYMCDDGFVAWINGIEVHRYNAPGGNIAFNGVASSAIGDATSFITADLTGATNYLVEGVNVIAVHALNANLPSTDFVIDLSLTSLAPDPIPPTVASKTPAPGTLSSLSQITVLFNEPVTGVNATDLLVNGTPASGLSGGNDSYTFTFTPPAYGTVNISWAANHGIVDFGVPPNPFNAAGADATWQYNYVDNVPPTILYQLPFAGVTVRSLTEIRVFFSEAVAGVNASDLLINGSPATFVSIAAPGEYVFQFNQPPPGPVQVSFASGHGITDLAVVANSFSGANWSYILDPNAVVAAVRINEIMTANIIGLRDEDNEYQDWVELFNTSSNAVSMAGWSLTDDPDEPTKWIFPPVAIPARGYLIVFCSGKDRKPTGVGTRLHTNFRLDPEGEYLALFNAEVPRQAVSVFDPYPNQRRDVSYGYDSVQQLKYFQTPTPGTANPSSAITAIVADTKFSHDRGFYDTNFSLSITCATAGATIRYTINGVAPTATTGTVYSGPINITNTTTIRVAAFRTGMLPSDVDCQTYLFTRDIILQAPTGQAPPGWPATWGGNVVNYGMDPDVVNSPLYKDTIQEDLKAIPSISVVMRLEDLFDSSTGIYANPGQDGIAWERACSVELIYPDDTQGFQINAGIRIRGGFSRSTGNPKHAFRLFFRSEYGPSKLVYPMFGPTGAQEFDKFDLRTMQNYSWSFQGDGNMICLRDVMSRDAQLAMGQPATRGNFYHLYINGMYWGLYNTEERPEASFGESYVGGVEDDYDVIKVEAGPYTINPTDGNMDAWLRLWQAAVNGLTNDVDYFKVQGLNVDGTRNPAYEQLLDVDNLIDYMLVILYGGNLDAPISNFLGNSSPNNWYGLRDRSGANGGFRFVSHDAEHTLLDVNSDRNGPYAAGDPVQQGAATAATKSNPQYIWQRLQANPEFRMRVADRVEKHCFNGGPLSVQGMRSLYLARSNEIQRAIVAESARWGDAINSAGFTRANWVNAINGVWNNFISGRTTVLVNQMRSRGLYPAVNAPIFSSRGGVVDDGFALFMTNNNGAGTLYYTLDGTDPRQRGGNIATTAIAYSPNTPVPINFPTTVRARIRSGTTWSAITEGVFYTRQNFSGLIVTEIMYNPPALGSIIGDDLEFIEFKNVGTNVLDFTAIGFSEGITFAFTNGTRLPPGQFYILGRNRGTLQTNYAGLTVHGVYSGRLDNGGERLSLTNASGARVFTVDYKDSGRWPITADGKGFSLVSRNSNANANPSNPSSWRASTAVGGSPGADDPAPMIAGVLINEVLTHTDAPVLDSIELFNPTAELVNIGGWFLTDDRTVPLKFRIPEGTTISAGGYLVFTEEDFNPTPGTNFSFSLESTGEQVYLLSGDANTNLTGYSHGFNFDAAPNGVSFGRHVISTGEEHFPLQAATTLEGTNSVPLVGPVVIRQIMYHPPDLPDGGDNTLDEYIEIKNITTNPVPLYDVAEPLNTWHVRGGVDFDFPYNIVLGPTQSVVLVSFFPDDPVAASAFRSKYGTLAGVTLYGPYSGKLDNSSDTVRLERPDTPNLGSVPYIWVEQVDYRDLPPWPAAADGGGAALQRVNAFAYADDPANWIGSAPLTIASISPAYSAVRTNANVTITVNAYGTGDLRYQWRLNGADLASETNVSLNISNIQLVHDGMYTVQVTDLSGSVVSPPAEVRVLVTPVVTQPPLSQTVVAGGLVTLSATYTGNPGPFTNEWRFFSTPVATNVTFGRTTFYSFIAPTNAASQQYRVVIKSASSPSLGVSHTPAQIVVLPDSDLDGIPDNWESTYGSATNVNDAEIDSDGDTMTNLEEYIAGTNPTDSESYLKISGPELGFSANLIFQAVSNKTYSVYYKENLDAPAWSKLVDVVAAPTNRVITVTDPGVTPNRFYHLVTPRQP